MSDVNNLADGIQGIKLSPSKKLQPGPATKPAPPKPSSIFLQKKTFSSLQPKRKPLATQGNSTRAFDKNAFFSDTPMAVDDKRWGNNLIKKDGQKPEVLDLTQSPTKAQPKGNVILNPMNANKVDPRENVPIVQSGFQKYAKSDSPFKDPYSALNNGSVHRPGAMFLDKPELYKEDHDLAEKLIKEITSIDDEKEIEKLKSEKIEDKDRTVKGLSVNLLDHQVLGLKFLRKREKEKHVHKGGMLCDDMGLGKTVQMIALIVKNGAKEEDLENLDDIEDEYFHIVNADVPKRKFKGTLVICPVSLTTQWVQEIKRFAPHLKPFLYHGTNRPKSYKELMKYDVVVSSYETIRSDFKLKSSPIFSGFWHRVVLDEAHNIKNRKAKTTIACFNVESTRRWVLTGTPVQNSVDELQGLLSFLRVSRLSNEREWKEVMTKVLRKGDKQEAFDLLKKELSIFMLRRTKKVLQATNFKLPTKTITRCMVEFSEMERELYEDLKAHFVKDLSAQFNNVRITRGDIAPGTKGVLYDKLSPSKLGKVNNDSTFYMVALVFLLRLRQVCCHWKLLSDLKAEDLEELGQGRTESNPLAITASPSKSPSKRDMDVDKELDDITNFMNALTVKETKCELCLVEKVKEGEKMCKSCTEKLDQDKKYESAKMLKLLEILKKDPKRKTIVFSQFRELLVLIGPTLQKHGFKYVMYEGRMKLKQKDAALDTLRNDPDTTVLLCSLKSGAVGLNLTVASQVVIYDPWWNPQIQEQAVDRVYRIGQTKPVDVYEFAVKDTVEIGILRLQDSKRELAKAIMNNDSSSTEALNKLSTSDIMKLFGIK